jgi:hypothetical protein
VKTGAVVCTTTGVGVARVGVTVRVLEFLAFVFLIDGKVHPATNTQLTIMKRVRSLINFKEVGEFFPGGLISAPNFS